MGSAVYALQVYDRVVAHAGYSSLVALSVGMLIAIALDHVLRSGRAELLQRMGLRIEAEIARSAFQRLMNLPTALLESRPAAYWQTVFRDIELVRATCSGATALLLIDLPFLLLSLVLLAVIAWPLLPVALVTIAAFVVLAWRSGRVTRAAAESERERLISRDAAIAELAGARLLLKASGASGTASTRWEKNHAAWMEESLARSQKSDHYRDLAAWHDHPEHRGHHRLRRTGHPGQPDDHGRADCRQHPRRPDDRTPGAAGRAVADHRPVHGRPQAARRPVRAGPGPQRDRRGPAPPHWHPARSMPPASATLAASTRSCRRLSGQLGPFGLHAVVGANGSGKTTLLKLLRGLYAPTSGRVLLDGGDMAQFSQADLARWIGYLPQQVQLLSGSIRDNIALADPAIDDAQIIAAARRAGAHDFIMALPDGYATEVGDGGSRFSGGERKRIAIAQVLLRDPPVLLLDEPTADLDRDAEQAFLADPARPRHRPHRRRRHPQHGGAVPVQRRAGAGQGPASPRPARRARCSTPWASQAASQRPARTERSPCRNRLTMQPHPVSRHASGRAAAARRRARLAPRRQAPGAC